MKFEGEIEVFNEVQTKFLEAMLVKHGFSNCTVKIQSVGKKGDNFASSVKRIVAEDKNERSLRLIAKIAPSKGVVRTAAGGMFSNEIFIYDVFLPKIIEIQKSAGVPIKEYFKHPKCYGFLSKAPEEVILLEDLGELNYVTRNKMISLTDTEIKAVLYELAIFHCLSFVLRYNEHNFFEQAKYKFIDIPLLLINGSRAKDCFQNVTNDCLALLDSEVDKNNAVELISNTLEISMELQKFEKESCYSAIVHADCWTNNIMFKEEANNLNCILIDYQKAQCSSPAKDLLFFIFNCSDYETRSEYYDDWIDYYYSVLESSLSTYGLKVNTVLPKNVLQADFKRYGNHVFASTLLVAGITMREPDEVLYEESGKFEDMMNMKNLSEETITKVKKRVNDLWKSFNECGYL